MNAKETATRNSSGNWSYKGITIWRSDFIRAKDSNGEWLDCYPPSLVRWELTDEYENCSINGTFKTLRAAKQFIDQQKKEGNK